MEAKQGTKRNNGSSRREKFSQKREPRSDRTWQATVDRGASHSVCYKGDPRRPKGYSGFNLKVIYFVLTA